MVNFITYCILYSLLVCLLKLLYGFVPKENEGEGSCTKLTGLARFIEACISPIGIGEFEGGFRGCLDISLEPISLQRSMCVDFKGTRKDGSANFVPVAELDDVEMEAAEEEDDEEDEE